MITQGAAEIQPIDNLFGNNFLRRPDLALFTRLHIAYKAFEAKIFGLWGTVTALSRNFNVSRTFIYNTLATFEEAVNSALGPSAQAAPFLEAKKNAASVMASLRLEGRCSIGAIVIIMKRLGLRFSSQGSISQYLNHFGSLVPDTLTNESDSQCLVFLSDEIFSNGTPILITVDPISSAILKIELAPKRRAKEWKRHWRCLENNGFEALYIVTDEGTGLCAAHDELFIGVMRQPDTYHTIAHQLGQWVNRLEKSAEKTIEEEYDREKKFDSSRSEEVITKRLAQYEEAREKAKKAIDAYEDFHYFYFCIINELQPFTSTGTLRDRNKSEENIRFNLALIELLGNNKINKAITKINRILPDLLNYFDVASKIVSKLEELPIHKEALKSLCIAWQWNKSIIKSKKSGRRQRCREREQSHLEFAVGYLQEEFDYFKDRIYSELDQIIQSSALVECINSIIRPYLNSSKGHVNQEDLNLMMFYHNHRRYNAGKRAKKTPMEILTGKPQEKDWLELLFQLIEEKDHQFFSSIQ